MLRRNPFHFISTDDFVLLQLVGDLLQRLPVPARLLVQVVSVGLQTAGLVLHGGDGLEAGAVALDEVPAGVEQSDHVQVAAAPAAVRTVCTIGCRGARRAETQVFEFLVI